MRNLIVALLAGLLVTGTVLAQETEQPQEEVQQEEQTEVKTDPDAQQIAVEGQVAVRYSPMFLKFVNQRYIVKIDEFFTDANGDVTKWCAFAFFSREDGSLEHCLH